MGKEVSLFIIVTTGKHSSSVPSYHHLSVVTGKHAVFFRQVTLKSKSGEHVVVTAKDEGSKMFQNRLEAYNLIRYYFQWTLRCMCFMFPSNRALRSHFLFFKDHTCNIGYCQVEGSFKLQTVHWCTLAKRWKDIFYAVSLWAHPKKICSETKILFCRDCANIASAFQKTQSVLWAWLKGKGFFGFWMGWSSKPQQSCYFWMIFLSFYEKYEWYVSDRVWSKWLQQLPLWKNLTG